MMPIYRMRNSTQRGVSLIELMVAMIVALLIAAAIGGLYLSSRQSARLTENTVAKTEVELAGLEDVARSLRSAGSYGCFSARKEKIGWDARMPESNGLFKFPIPFVAGTNPLEPRVGPLFPVFGGNVSGLVLSGGSGLTPVAGSDFLEYNFGRPVSALIEALPPNDTADYYTSPIKVGTPVRIRSGMPLVITDCSAAKLVRADVSGNNWVDATSIPHDPASGDNYRWSTSLDGSNGGNAAGQFKAGAVLFRLDGATFFVATDSAQGTHLYRWESGENSQPQPVARNVVDMRVRFGVTDAGATTWNTGAAVDAAGDWPNVSLVEVHLVLTTAEKVASGITGARMYNMSWSESERRFAYNTSSPISDGKPRSTSVLVTALRGNISPELSR